MKIKRNGNANFMLKRDEENDDEVRESGRKVKDTTHGEGSHEVAGHGIGLRHLLLHFCRHLLF